MQHRLASYVVVLDKIWKYGPVRDSCNKLDLCEVVLRIVDEIVRYEIAHREIAYCEYMA